MIDQINSSRGMRVLFGLAAIGYNNCGHLPRTISCCSIPPFIFSRFTGYTTCPLAKEKTGTIDSIAVLVVMAIIVIIILLIGAQITTSFSGFTEELPQLQSLLREQVIELVAFLKSKGLLVKDKFLLEYINPEAILKLTAGLLTGLSAALSDLVLVLITVTFILLEISSFPVKIRKILGNPEQVFPRFTKFIIDMKSICSSKLLST